MAQNENLHPPGKHEAWWIPFHNALTTDAHEKIPQLIKDGADVNHVFSSGIFYRYPAHICCDKGSVEVLKILIQENTNLDCKDQWGQRPLHYAVKKRQHTVLELLLKTGVAVNARDNSLRSPLFYAIELGDLFMVDMLLNSGASVNLQDRRGHSPLHIAASRDIFCRLLKRMLEVEDVKVDLCDAQRQTPLQHAVLEGSVDEVTALLMAKSYPNVIDCHGNTPLLNAVTSYCRSAVEEAHLEKIEWLVKFGADVNIANTETGRTPLHLLVGTRQNCSHLMKLFIKFGADVNKQDDNGCTPLLLALLAGNKEAAKLLIYENCDIDLVGTVTILSDTSHRSPVNVCILQGLLNICDILLAAGAKIRSQEYSDIHYFPHQVSYVKSRCSEVPALMLSCRSVIRQRLGPSPKKHVSQLGLPNYLLRFVLLENELEFED